jgi:hypothetical protein
MLGHEELKRIPINETRVKKTVVGIIVDKSSDQWKQYTSSITDGVVVDINYEVVYNNFLQISYAAESVAYIKEVVESFSTRESLINDFIVDRVLLNLINKIESKKVYVVIDAEWKTDWLDKTLEV